MQGYIETFLHLWGSAIFCLLAQEFREFFSTKKGSGKRKRLRNIESEPFELFIFSLNYYSSTTISFGLCKNVGSK
jgi:hypothetical protein